MANRTLSLLLGVQLFGVPPKWRLFECSVVIVVVKQPIRLLSVIWVCLISLAVSLNDLLVSFLIMCMNTGYTSLITS